MDLTRQHCAPSWPGHNPPCLVQPSPPALCATRHAWCLSVVSAETSGSSALWSWRTSSTMCSTTTSPQTSNQLTVTCTTGLSRSAQFLRDRLQCFWHDDAVPHLPSPNHVHVGCPLLWAPDDTSRLTSQTGPTWSNCLSPT